MERQPKCGDSWIYPAKDINPLGPIQLQDQNLLVSDLLSRETKEWNKHLIEDTLPLLANQFISIRPSTLGAHDSFVWAQHPSGIYSAKSGYYSSQQAKIHSTSERATDERQPPSQEHNYRHSVFETSRSQLLFDKRASTLQEVLIKATIACREWDGAQSNLIKLAQDKPLHLPPPQPSSDIVVCYTDAAWNSTCRAADVAWIFTDRHGT
ncbi:uncharacterized protein LOC125585092 [Brassica napus]|uniref:uncharacterized protein LOC125585092 n=1 Tax=Brassica napus TaxID=3708 RepID=UPI002078B03E|nr:uncharacterized protein LOC125585092 [Brassica napus]